MFLNHENPESCVQLSGFTSVPGSAFSSQIKIYTAFLPFFTAALPHDWEYSLPKKSYMAFTAANWRFAVNSCIEALDERRLSMVFMGLALAALCQVFGWSGYLQGGIEHDD